LERNAERRKRNSRRQQRRSLARRLEPERYVDRGKIVHGSKAGASR
jgi:hypothetical protein